MKKSSNILLVDDNPDEIFFICRSLKKLSREPHVEVVSDGVQAIERLAASQDEEHAPLPDLMILDLNLPRKSGFEVLQWLKDHRIPCPVVLHTSSDDPRDLQKGHRLGATGYVVKQVGYKPLLAKLEEVLSDL